MRKFGVEIIWLIVLLALVIAMGILLISGDILFYLAPRMVPMVWFGLVVFAVLVIYQFLHLVRCLRENRSDTKIRLNSLLFMVPIVLMLTVMPNENTSGTLPGKSVQTLSLTSESASEEEETGESALLETEQNEPMPDVEPSMQYSQTATSAPTQIEEAMEEATEEPAETSVEPIEVADAMPCTLGDETVSFNISDDLFSGYIYNTVEELNGQTITLYGFVYTDDSFPENTIMVSRLYLYCCAADAYVVGFHVKVEDTSEFEDAEWIRVTGKVQTVSLEYYGDYYNFPILTDGKIVSCEAPDAEDAYIYP